MEKGQLGLESFPNEGQIAGNGYANRLKRQVDTGGREGENKNDNGGPYL